MSSDNPFDPPEADVQFAETPTGEKAHLVDFGTESMLALGTRDTVNYASACGQVPDCWDQLTGRPNAAAVCAVCARSFLSQVDDAPVDRPFLLRAGGAMVDV